MSLSNQIEASVDPSLTNSLTHLYGLFSHIEEMKKRYVDGQTSQSASAGRYLADSFMSFARAYFDAFIKALDADTSVTQSRRPYLMHKAIQRLSGDWEELARILAAIDGPYIAVLEALVQVARPSAQWASDHVAQEEKRKGQSIVKKASEMPPQFITLPYFGRHFELISFKYAPDVFVTGVPLYNLESPWDWHVVWHEMAGHIVNLLEESKEIEKRIIPNLEARNYWQVWRARYDLASGRDTRERGSTHTGATTATVGRTGPDHAGDREAERETPPTWDEIRKADWIAEILEDAYGILSLGPAMYRSLEHVLRQNYADDFELTDKRHPPLRLRLDMAGAILLTRLAEKDHRSILTSLGFDDERIAACEELRPIAQVIVETLIGDGVHPSYIRNLFDPSEVEMAETLKQQLLENQELTPGATIPALINAAHLAFKQEPRAALHISKATKAAITAMSPIEAGLQSPAMPDNAVVQSLVDGKSWQELLDEPFSTSDNAAPLDHPSDKGVWLEWSTPHGRHKIWHATSDHK